MPVLFAGVGHAQRAGRRVGCRRPRAIGQDRPSRRGQPTRRHTLEVVSILKNFQDRLKAKGEVQVPGQVTGRAGDLFLLTGTAEGRDSTTLTWDTPQPISEIGFYYLKQAPGPEAAKEKRLRYFLKFLEYPDPLLATDAYSEFAKADYGDLVLIKDALPREKIRTWIQNPGTLASRLGLYGLMLGICGNKADAELLKAKILDNADKTRLGIDGIMGGYCCSPAKRGWSFWKRPRSKIRRPPWRTCMPRWRRCGSYGNPVTARFPKTACDRRCGCWWTAPMWRTWRLPTWPAGTTGACRDRLMEIYKKGNPDNPLGEIAVRRAIIRYMIASTLAGKDDPAPPPHIAKGKQHLETLRKLDPRTVENFERLMRRE